jgi:hypothetical protein
MSFFAPILRLQLETFEVVVPTWRMGEYERPTYDTTPVELLPCGTVAIGGLYVQGDKLKWIVTIDKADLLIADRITAIGKRCRQLADARLNPAVRLWDYGWRFQEPAPRTRAIIPDTIEELDNGWVYYYAQYDVFVYDVRVTRNGGFWAVTFNAIELGAVAP